MPFWVVIVHILDCSCRSALWLPRVCALPQPRRLEHAMQRQQCLRQEGRWEAQDKGNVCTGASPTGQRQSSKGSGSTGRRPQPRRQVVTQCKGSSVFANRAKAVSWQRRQWKYTWQRQCPSHEREWKPTGQRQSRKGSGSIGQRQCLTSSSQKQWKHKARAVETQGKGSGNTRQRAVS